MPNWKTDRLINEQWWFYSNLCQENYKLTELAAKLQELMLNDKDSDYNNLNWKHDGLTN